MIVLIVRRVSFAIAAALGAVAACVDLGGLANDAPGTPDASDGASNATDASDATDASAPDDAADAADARCVGATWFCDDFDLGSLGSKWTATRIEQDAQLDLDTDAYVSPPRSLRVRLYDRDANAPDYRWATLTKDGVATTLTKFRCELDARFDVAAFYEYVLTVSATGSDFVTYEASLGLGGGDGLFEEYVAYADGGYTSNTCKLGQASRFSPGQWRHVVVEADYASKTATVSVDGTNVCSTQLGIVPQASSVSIAAGVSLDVDIYRAWDYRIDNLACEVH